MLEELLIDMAKKEYVEDLQKALDGRFTLSSVFTAPDPEKIKEEIRTLAHFRLYKPNQIAMNQRDGELLDGETYTYESLDWKAMGCELLPSHPLKWNPSEGDIVDLFPEDSGYDDMLAMLYEEEGRD